MQVIDVSKRPIITGSDAPQQERIAVTQDLHAPDGTTSHGLRLAV
jgi:hypothetical protein